MDEQNKASPTWGRYIPGELLERWPRDEEGNPDPPVYLCHCEPLGMAEQLTVSRMESYGIPCLRQDPENGGFGRLSIGVSGTGTDIFGPASLWADACELLREPEETEREELSDELA